MLLVVCQLSRDIIGYEGSGLRSPERSCSTYFFKKKRERKNNAWSQVTTARTVSTLHTVQTALWPYRPYDCTDSAVVTDCLRRSNRKFSFNQSASSSGKALHYWNIRDFFYFFKSTGALFCFFLYSMNIFGSILEISLSISGKGIELIKIFFLMLKAWFLR